MKALILAAGYGTRMYPIIKDTPKALLDIKGKPIINHVIDRLRSFAGLNEIIVVTNNKFHQILEDWAKRAKALFPKITVVNDGTNTPEDRLGSIGDIKFILDKVKLNDDLVVVGSDNLFNFNLDEYIRFAIEKKPKVSIGLFDIGNIKEATKFGVVELDKMGKIASFEEKPAEPKSSLIAMCFYFLPKETLGLIGRYIKETNKADKAGEYIKWLKENDTVYGFTFKGKWFDIGSIESYNDAQANFN
jgi:glucose-1-phosphate thymidylyltransferase